MKTMCATCPWQEGSPYKALVPVIRESAKTVGRICHNTGESIFSGDTGKPERLCRGARDEQLATFFQCGFLKAPTDEAWEEKCKELGL